ncbi:MAG: glutathione synthase [Candidatus Melainabacteria bacterium]|jgi:glutathione synthase|nr:glutathione synthase [Candidatus Melainabacteria bacterium]
MISRHCEEHSDAAIQKILFIADDIECFITNHDSTWVMMKAAHHLGDEVSYALAEDLQEDGSSYCLTLSDEFFVKQEGQLLVLDQLSKDSKTSLQLDDFDYIFMRKDPPVDDEYKRECEIMAQCTKAKVINNPNSLIELNEKLMILNFPDLIIETIVTDEISEIEAFVNKHGKLVMKPLDGFGGAGISLLELDRHCQDEGRSNLMHALNLAIGLPRADGARNDKVMLQKYIPDIKIQGDKRIIVVNGEPIGALLRIPPENDFRANLAVGGSYAKHVMSDRDREICAKIKPFLLENGIYFAGVDLIGDYLTEINITSPTCLQEINRVEGLEGKEGIEYQLMAEII